MNFMPANNPFNLFISLLIMGWLWIVFSSLNALAVANDSTLGCCKSGDCGKGPIDTLLFRGTLGLAIIMTLVFVVSLYYYFMDRQKNA